MNQDTTALNQISQRIIGCAFTVMNTLGCGFLEKVYENALAHELRKANLRVVQQFGMTVMYDGASVGDYTADMVVEDSVIVELKAVKTLDGVHSAQCLNYLKASGLPLCLLLNFGKPRVEIQRIAN
jgi:GxxExxY protein